jgi:hypothetical protein
MYALALGSNKSATSSVLVLPLNGSGDSIHVADLPLTVGGAEDEAAGGAGGAVISGVSTGGSCGVSSTTLSSSEVVMTCFFFFCCAWLAGATLSSDVSRSVRSSVVKLGSGRIYPSTGAKVSLAHGSVFTLTSMPRDRVRALRLRPRSSRPWCVRITVSIPLFLE